MSSLKEVARQANTSTATVSRVINKTGYVSESMTKRVLDAINALDYKPLQREGKSKKTKTIALVTPDIENPFFAKMTKEVTKIANELKYNVLLINVSGLKNDGGDFLMSIIDSKVDGVIYASSYRLQDVITKAKSNNIPMVVLDREIKTMEIDIVAVNNNQAGFIATDHLIGLGHEKIAFIGGTESMDISSQRLEGYMRALDTSGIEFDSKLVVRGDFSMASGYKAVEALLISNQNITGIIAANDLMAIGAVNSLNVNGLKIPTDISVVGFDDIELASSLTPKLTTVSYPLERMSQLAMESIIKQIDDDDFVCENVSLYPKLIVRESTGEFVSKK